MDVPSPSNPTLPPTLDVPEGLTDGIYFVITHWLAPIGSIAIEAAVTALIVAGGKAIEKEFKFTGGSIVGVFNQMLQILGGTSDAYGVPNASGVATTTTQLAALEATLGTWPTVLRIVFMSIAAACRRSIAHT